MSYIDPFGLEVIAFYNTAEGTLNVVDVDTGQSASARASSGGKPFGDPLPPGGYEILDQARNPESFRLDPIDSILGDDRHEPTGRDLFRLHEPGMTWGCIAAEDRDEWNAVRDLINNTSTTTTQDRASPWWKFWAKDAPITKYGTLIVK